MKATLGLALLLSAFCRYVRMESVQPTAGYVPSSTKDNASQNISKDVTLYPEQQMLEADMTMSLCPEVKEGRLEICGKPCENDSQCEDGERCCPNACDQYSCRVIEQFNQLNSEDLLNKTTAPVSYTPDNTSTNISRELYTSDPTVESSRTTTVRVPLAQNDTSTRSSEQDRFYTSEDDVSATSEHIDIVTLQEANTPPPCPEVMDGTLGICGKPCEDDSQCEDGRRCCPDSCNQQSCQKIERRNYTGIKDQSENGDSTSDFNGSQ